jgi:hypothetical protein
MGTCPTTVPRVRHIRPQHMSFRGEGATGRSTHLFGPSWTGTATIRSTPPNTRPAACETGAGTVVVVDALESVAGCGRAPADTAYHAARTGILRRGRASPPDSRTAGGDAAAEPRLSVRRLGAHRRTRCPPSRRRSPLPSRTTNPVGGRRTPTRRGGPDSCHCGSSPRRRACRRWRPSGRSCSATLGCRLGPGGAIRRSRIRLRSYVQRHRCRH